MPEHISIAYLVTVLTVGIVIRSLALLFFLWVMIKFQKLNFEWVPLIASAFLAGSLDMIPFIGHYIAFPALYLCIWKTTRATLFPDAVFTVALSYALLQCTIIILLAYTGPKINLRANHDNYDFDNDPAGNAPMAMVQSTNRIPKAETAPKDQMAPDISVTGVIHSADGGMVTIQCGSKNYTLSPDEGVMISTRDGTVSVHLIEVGAQDVTLSVGGQKMKYALK